jgi:anti-sigma factor RsiW
MHPGLDLLLSYTDAELSPAESRKVERHLDECAECRLEVRRLRVSNSPHPHMAVPADNLVQEIRHWSAHCSPAQDRGIKERIGAEIDPYLGAGGSSRVLNRISADGALLSEIEGVLTDFVGRRAVGPLVDSIVEHAIMRTCGE